MAKISLDKIVIDDEFYPRNSVSEVHVKRLQLAIQTGSQLPPLVLEAKTHRLVDGRHRLDAYKSEGVESVEVVEKVYANEADFFADAVRYNIGHGEPLDQYAIKSAIIRLDEYGYSRDKICELIRIPVEQIEKITKGFAISAETGKPMALKGGLSHLAGHRLDSDQQQVNRHYSGGKAVFYLRQLCNMLENEMWPVNSPAFAHEMDRIVEIWTSTKREEAA